MIAERAYHIWEMEGRPDGKDIDHWLRAERELASEMAQQAVPAAAKAPKTRRRKK
jgi:hypothetical protein